VELNGGTLIENDVKKAIWNNLMFLPGIFLEGLRKTTKDLSG
jgi:hypothetical protein